MQSNGSRPERRQSRKFFRWAWRLLRRRWFLKLLIVIAPVVARIVELVIVILRLLM